MDMKICCRCGEEHSTSYYHRQKGTKDGLSPRCKTCESKRKGNQKRPVIEVLLQPTEAAYLAGLVDGEGYIGLLQVKRKRGRRSSFAGRVVIGMCWEGLKDVRELVGCGKVWFKKHANPKHNDQWVWSLTGNHCRALLPVIRPYLKVKARQADLLLDYLHLADHRNRSEEYRDAVMSLYEELRVLNTRGRIVGGS